MQILKLGYGLMAGLVSVAASGASPELNLIPQPAHVTVGQGKLNIDQGFSVGLSGYREPRLARAAVRLIHHLDRKTGMPLSPFLATDASRATLEITTGHAGEAVQKLGEDESYRLEVTPNRARINAPQPLGALRGMETFLQLVDADKDSFAAPAVWIEDRPRFPWRGLMLDVSRHWMPEEVVKRNIDAIAAVKMNVFHWHLSDNQGFRVECRKFPELHQLGSDGRFYTQDEVRDVIAYARDRGVRVVPEFDIPGHTTAWFVGHPELASGPGPYTIERKWGVFDPAMDPTREEVYQFLDTFIGEMAALFPDAYFHVGGDEVNGKQWDGNPRIQAFMREHGIKDNAALQAYFNTRVEPLVRKYGKKMIGWDEILDPSLPKDIVIQSWRGQKSLAEAARLGYSGLLSAGYYLDLMYPASQHYASDPLTKETADLAAQEKARILGGESAMWVEFATPENIDMRIWPRNAAIAERLWSPQDVTDPGSMYRRLAVVSRELEGRGMRHTVSHHLMLERLAGDDPLGPLSALSDVIEPVKEYAREQAREYTSFIPLNRLVDATRPESDVARTFGNAVDRLLSGGSAQQSDREQVRNWLVLWRDNDAKLEPTLQRSFLLQEAVPLSQDLSKLGSIGLEALDHLTNKRPAPQSWTSEQLRFLENAKKPRAELLIMIVPSVQKLVEAAGHAH